MLTLKILVLDTFPGSISAISLNRAVIS